MDFTGERFIPSEQGEIRLEHYHRYAAVLDIVAGKDVLDVACGEGYGSFLMAGAARTVMGVDIADEAVVHASNTYKSRSNLQFRQDDVTGLQFADSSFDVAVSFETIEHLAEQSQMLAEIRRVLRPSGVLVLSSPNRPIYSEARGFHNHFHVKELDFEELDCLVRAHFPAVRYFGQRLMIGSMLQPLEGVESQVRAWHDDGSELRPALGRQTNPVYFLAVCAELESMLPAIEPSILHPTKLDLLEEYRGFARWAKQTNEELDQLRHRYAALDQEHYKVGTWAHSLDQQVGALHKTNDELSAQMDQLRGRYTQLENEHKALLLNLTASQKQEPSDSLHVQAWSDSSAINEGLVVKSAALERIEEAQKHCERPGSCGQGLEQVLYATRELCSQLQTKFEACSAWADHLNSDLAAANRQIASLQVDIQRERDKSVALQNEFSRLQTISRKLQSDHDENIGGLSE